MLDVGKNNTATLILKQYCILRISNKSNYLEKQVHTLYTHFKRFVLQSLFWTFYRVPSEGFYCFTAERLQKNIRIKIISFVTNWRLKYF